MLGIKLFLFCAALAVMGLGIAVFANNYRRKTNQTFLVASTFMLMWLLSNLFILNSHSSDIAHIGMNFAFAISACIPTTFHFLRIAIKHPSLGWLAILNKCKLHIVLNALVSTSSFFPGFVKSVSFPVVLEGISLATPEYRPSYIIFNAYFLSAITFFTFCLYKDRKALVGAQRIELEFLGFACVAGLVVGISCGTIFALLIKTSELVPIAHASSVLTLALIVAYGISVHKVLAVAFILRSIATYSLLSCYLIAVYLISWFSLGYILKELAITAPLPAHIASTLIVVFSMSPARKKLQKAAGRLISVRSTDLPSVIKTSGEMFQSVTTYDALLSKFSTLLANSFSSQHVTVLIDNNPSGLAVVYSTDERDFPSNLPVNKFLATLISKTHEPVSRDSLNRQRPTELIKGTMRQLDDLEACIAVGFFVKSALKGIVLLGDREDGHIYDKNEQDALQILSHQFAVALENAQMYTEVQDSKIRNDIMLDQLVSGVLVADPERKISLINNEAQRITGLGEEVLGQGLGLLPGPLSEALETTLATKSGLQNTNVVLLAQEEEKNTYVRMGSAYLLGHDQKPMGALLVFTDMTEIKGLEEQVRRADQLSSVGTLAAGMAHEIKNPLVTIKTFARLLPERYDDADFREEFSALVAHEVSRIDGIVTQLLRFSKPSQPHLVPTKLHDTVEKILRLTHEQASLKNIALNKNLQAEHDLISGDVDLLTQALVNFILNAIDAMKSDGVIDVASTNCPYRFAQDNNPNRVVVKSCIKLQISDTGKGIANDQIHKIFNPFFTSKSEGVGMGLSVAHRIIREHHGVIEVDSSLGKGTTFSIYIPVLEEDTAA